jgi:hypothetical protein
MGMYSFVVEHELVFRSKEHKQRLIDEGYKVKCKTCDERLQCIVGNDTRNEKCRKKWLENYFSWDKKSDTFTILFDERKIISYWYEETCKFLKFIAKYIEGEMRLDFETDEEKAIITFEKGECKVNLGIMEWKNFSIDEMK